MTLIGGMGTIFGPVVGAFVVIALENYLSQLRLVGHGRRGRHLRGLRARLPPRRAGAVVAALEEAPMSRLSGQGGHCVTGAASGLGRAIAERSLAKARASASRTSAGGPGRAPRAPGRGRRWRQMDVTDEAQVEEGVAPGGLEASAGSTCWSATRASSTSRRWWTSRWAVASDAGHPPRRGVPHDPGLPASHVRVQGQGGTLIYMGSVHSKEASPLKAPYVTAKHGLIGLCQSVAKEGAARACAPTSSVRLRAHAAGGQADSRAGPGFGISEAEVVKNVMLKNTVDGEFTTTGDVADAAVFFGVLPHQRPHRPIDHRQPRLAHGVSRAAA